MVHLTQKCVKVKNFFPTKSNDMFRVDLSYVLYEKVTAFHNKACIISGQ